MNIATMPDRPVILLYFLWPLIIISSTKAHSEIISGTLNIFYLGGRSAFYFYKSELFRSFHMTIEQNASGTKYTLEPRRSSSTNEKPTHPENARKPIIKAVVMKDASQETAGKEGKSKDKKKQPQCFKAHGLKPLHDFDYDDRTVRTILIKPKRGSKYSVSTTGYGSSIDSATIKLDSKLPPDSFIQAMMKLEKDYSRFGDIDTSETGHRRPDYYSPKSEARRSAETLSEGWNDQLSDIIAGLDCRYRIRVIYVAKPVYDGSEPTHLVQVGLTANIPGVPNSNYFYQWVPSQYEGAMTTSFSINLQQGPPGFQNSHQQATATHQSEIGEHPTTSAANQATAVASNEVDEDWPGSFHEQNSDISGTVSETSSVSTSNHDISLTSGYNSGGGSPFGSVLFAPHPQSAPNAHYQTGSATHLPVSHSPQSYRGSFSYSPRGYSARHLAVPGQQMPTAENTGSPPQLPPRSSPRPLPSSGYNGESGHYARPSSLAAPNSHQWSTSPSSVHLPAAGQQTQATENEDNFSQLPETQAQPLAQENIPPEIMPRSTPPKLMPRSPLTPSQAVNSPLENQLSKADQQELPEESKFNALPLPPRTGPPPLPPRNNTPSLSSRGQPDQEDQIDIIEATAGAITEEQRKAIRASLQVLPYQNRPDDPRYHYYDDRGDDQGGSGTGFSFHGVSQ